MGQFPMTPAGHQALQEELRDLKTNVRPTVIKDIAEARSHGDLSENAEYDAAREKQGFVEARIRDVEAKLSRAQVIDPANLTTDKVVFGTTVTIFDAETEAEQIWTIVGEDEADLKNKKLSCVSPLARALVGRQIGDSIEIKTPKGIKECEVVKISFKTH